MSKIELTKQWVNDALDKLIANNTLSYNQVNSSSDKLVALFKQKAISKSTITAFELLVACVSYFIFQDLKQQKYSPAVNLNIWTTPYEHIKLKDLMERELLDNLKSDKMELENPDREI